MRVGELGSRGPGVGTQGEGWGEGRWNRRQKVVEGTGGRGGGEAEGG